MTRAEAYAAPLKGEAMQSNRISIGLLLLCLVGASCTFAQMTGARDKKNLVDVSARVGELDSTDPTVRAMAACFLGEAEAAAAPAIPRLIKLLADDAQTGRIHCDKATHPNLLPAVSSPAAEAVKALASIGKPATEPLLQALRHNQDVRIRARAAEALAGIEAEHSLKDLIDAAGGTNPLQVRVQAIRALSRFVNTQSLEALRSALNDESDVVRREATWSLTEWSDALALDTLLLALNDKSWEVRVQAVRGLQSIGNERALKHIIAALKDEKQEVRWQVVETLGRLGDTRAEPTLNSALNDESPLVRRQAQSSLMRLKGTHPDQNPSPPPLN